MAVSVREGDIAPDFELPAQAGGTVRLSDYRGQRVVVLYFYPKDYTPGCTAEACAFRDSYEVFTDAGAEVIGVSSDSIASHERFSAAHRVPFALVSDADGQVRRRYGVKARFGVLPGRVTYVIDRDGIVRHVFSSMTNIGGHVAGALAVVEKLTADA
ncbi:MAG TPA: peroxiredoxin [Jiangellaceae bacterium]